MCSFPGHNRNLRVNYEVNQEQKYSTAPGGKFNPTLHIYYIRI